LIIFRPKGQSHRLELTRPWTHLIKMPGLRGAPEVKISCTSSEHRHSLITPRRVRVRATINLSTGEISLTEPGKRITWSHLPDTIARSTAHLDFEHIVHVPEGKPPIRKVTGCEFKSRIDKVTTLRDRLIIKGTASITLTYHDA